MYYDAAPVLCMHPIKIGNRVVQAAKFSVVVVGLRAS